MVDPADAYYVSRHWFCAGLGFVYAIAFWSLYAQFPGLYGDDGINPISVYNSRHGLAKSDGGFAAAWQRYVGGGGRARPTLTAFAPALGLRPAVVQEGACLAGLALSLAAVFAPPLWDALAPARWVPGGGWSAFAFGRWCTAPVLAALWVLYLSCYVTGGTFLSFQWDILLLETGVVAALWAPCRGVRRTRSKDL